MMNKFVYYFFFLMATTAIVFLTSCEEDPEMPGGDLSVSLSPSDEVQAAPGDTVEVTVTLSNASTGVEAMVVSDPGGSFVDGDNTAASGESVSFIIPDDAELGVVYTLTASVTDGGAQANAQLDITVGYGTVVDIATKNEDFSILVAALTEAGLVADLQGTGPFTVFAPTNAAFEAIGITADNVADVEGLEDILNYHVIAGTTALSSDLTDDQYIETAEGDSVMISIDGDVVMVDEATVSSADIEAENGVVHVIDQVLLPDNISTFPATLVFPPSGDEASKTFFSTVDGDTYSFNDVVSTTESISPMIDFGYFYGVTTEASFISPDENIWSNPAPTGVGYDMDDWGTRNATEFRTTNLTVADFDAINVNQDFTLAAEYEVGTAPDNPKRITNLAEGDIIAFSASDDRFGLIKVISITPGAESNDNIEIEVKVTR